MGLASPGGWVRLKPWSESSRPLRSRGARPKSLENVLNPEPLISCGLAGSAEFRERELGETWVTDRSGAVISSSPCFQTLFEVRHSSRVGEHLEIIKVHVGVDHFLESLEAVYPGEGDEVS
jgi:hypothetical protein